MTFLRSKRLDFGSGLILFLLLGLLVFGSGTASAQGESSGGMSPGFSAEDCGCEGLGWVPVDVEQGFQLWENLDWLEDAFPFVETALHCEYGRPPGNEPRLALSIIHTDDLDKIGRIFDHYVEARTQDEEACAASDNCSVFDKAVVRGESYALAMIRKYEGGGRFRFTGGKAVVHQQEYLIVASGLGYNDQFPAESDFNNAIDRLIRCGVGVVNIKEGVPPETEEPLAYVQWQSGRVQVQRPFSDDWLPVAEGMPVFGGDRVRVLDGALLQMLFEGEPAIARFGSDTVIQIPPLDETSFMNLLTGRVWMRIDDVRENRSFLITPNAVIDVKGTQFEVQVDEDGATTVSVLDGSLEISGADQAETVIVNSGEMSTVELEGVPSEAVPFEDDALDRWWDDYPAELDPGSEPEPTAEPSATEEESGSVADDEESGGGMGFIVIVVVIVAVIAIAGLVFFLIRKRRKEPETTVVSAPETVESGATISKGVPSEAATRTTAPSAEPAVSEAPSVAQPIAQPSGPVLKSPVCPKCGYRGRSGERFCRKCGTTMVSGSRPAPAPQPDATGADIECPKCGMVNAAESAFCKKCGSRMGS